MKQSPRGLYDSWSTEFLETCKKRLAGDTARQASSGEVKDLRRQIEGLALERSELSPRGLAVTFTDTKGNVVSEASVYSPLKAHDLIASPAFVVIRAADAFKDRTTAPNQLWETDFTYLKVVASVGWI